MNAYNIAYTIHLTVEQAVVLHKRRHLVDNMGFVSVRVFEQFLKRRHFVQLILVFCSIIEFLVQLSESVVFLIGISTLLLKLINVVDEI